MWKSENVNFIRLLGIILLGKGKSSPSLSLINIVLLSSINYNDKKAQKLQKSNGRPVFTYKTIKKFTIFCWSSGVWYSKSGFNFKWASAFYKLSAAISQSTHKIVWHAYRRIFLSRRRNMNLLQHKRRLHLVKIYWHGKFLWIVLYFLALSDARSHNWSLKSFNQDYDLASHTIYVVCINFIHEWRDLQFKVDSERQIFWETFSCQFFYLFSEFLPEIFWEIFAEGIFDHMW